MDEEVALSQALSYLLRARAIADDLSQAQELARQAIQLAAQWPDSWISKGIRVHAHGWFFYDVGKALEVLGGEEEVARLTASNSIVFHFTTAVGSLCGQRYDEALSSLRAAAEQEPANPFIDFLTAIVLIETNSTEAPAAVSRFAMEYANHPLCVLFQGLSPPERQKHRYHGNWRAALSAILARARSRARGRWSETKL
jgi:hypothetical protein